MNTWTFKPYQRPDDVGWAGVLYVLGEAIAFIGLDRRITFIDQLR